MESLIALLGSIAALVLLSIFTSAGIVQLALSRSAYATATPIVSIIFLPLLLIVSLAGFGHLDVGRIDWRLGHAYLCIGGIITLVVIPWRRLLSGQVHIAREQILALISGLLLLIPFCYLNSTASFAYNYLGNGEFLNYASLASATLDGTGELSDFMIHHRKLRYGQDLFLAYLSGVFGKSPIEMVHAISGYLLFAYGAVVGFIIVSSFKSSFLSGCLIAIHAAMLLPLFNFNASFFSSTIVLPASILLLAFSASTTSVYARDVGASRVFPIGLISADRVGLILLVALFVTFSAITYPEFGVPVVITAIAISSVLSIWVGGVTGAFLVMVLGLGLALVINPSLALGAVKGFFGQLGSGGGWNVFGDPRYNIGLFISNITGLSHPFAQRHLFFATGGLYSPIVFWFILFCLSIVGMYKAKSGLLVAVLAWASLALLVLFMPLFTGGHWYAAVKYFAQFSIGLVLVIGLAFLSLVDHYQRAIKLASRLLLVMISCMYVTANAYDVVQLKKSIETFSFENWKSSLSAAADNGYPLMVFDESEGEVIWFTELVAHSIRMKLLALGVGQVDRLARRGTPPTTTESGCITESAQLQYDFRGFPYAIKKFVAVVGLDDPINRTLKSTRGFALAVDKQKIIGKDGKFRFEEIEISTATKISFPSGSWAVDGVWAACLGADGRAISLGFDVPAALLKNGPISVSLTRGASFASSSIDTAGRYSLEVEPSSNNSNSSNVVILKSSATWTPKDVDASSTDIRRLGLNVVSLNHSEERGIQ